MQTKLGNTPRMILKIYLKFGVILKLWNLKQCIYIYFTIFQLRYHPEVVGHYLTRLHNVLVPELHCYWACCFCIGKKKKSSKQKNSKVKKDEDAEDEDDEASTDDSDDMRPARKKTSQLLNAKLTDSDEADSDEKPKTKK